MTNNAESFKEPPHVGLSNELRMLALRIDEAEELLKDLRATRNDVACQLVRDHGCSVLSVAREAHMTRAMLSERVAVANAMDRIHTANLQPPTGP